MRSTNDPNTFEITRHSQKGPAPRRVSYEALYGEPLVIVLAAISVALIFAVVLREPATNQADFYTFWDSARWYRAGGRSVSRGFVAAERRLQLERTGTHPHFLAFFLLALTDSLCLVDDSWPFGKRRCSTLDQQGTATAILVSRAMRFTDFSSKLLCTSVRTIVTLIHAAFRLGVDRRQERPPMDSRTATRGSRRSQTLFGTLRHLCALVPTLAAARSRDGAWCGGVVGIGLIVGGVSAYRSWLFALQAVTWPAHLANGSLLAVVARELTEPPNMITIAPLAIRPEWVLPIWGVLLALVGGPALWTLRKITNRDQAWLLVGVCSLLLSPLGWVYYAPLLAGPVIARWHEGARITRVSLGIGYGCFCIPYTFLVQPHGSAATFIIGGTYTWGLLAWLLAALF